MIRIDVPGHGSWPLDVLSEDRDPVEWRLRYGEPTREDLVTAAAIMAAYRALLEATTARRAAVVRALRNALARCVKCGEAPAFGGDGTVACACRKHYSQVSWSQSQAQLRRHEAKRGTRLFP